MAEQWPGTVVSSPKAEEAWPGTVVSAPASEAAPAEPQGFLSAFWDNTGRPIVDAAKSLPEVPGAFADVVRAQAESGDPSVAVAPGAVPILTQFAKDVAGASADSYRHQREMGASVPVAALAGTPIIGPPAAQAGEELGRGDYAAGLGHAAGMLAPFAVKPAVGVAGKVAGKVPVPTLDQAIRAAEVARHPFRATGGAVVRGLLEGAVAEIEKPATKAQIARVSHVLRREAPAVVREAAEALKVEPGAPAGNASPAINQAAGRAAAPRSSSAPAETTPPAGVRVVQEAAEAPKPTGPVAVASKADPRIAPGGWREVGIGNWYGTEDAPKPADWARMGGAKAQRAWLESRNLIPGSNTAQDVATAAAKGIPPEQIEKLYGTARPPAAGNEVAKAAQKTAKAAKPKPVADQVAGELIGKVESLKAKGLSDGQIADAVSQLYGVPKGTAKKMTAMVLEGPK